MKFISKSDALGKIKASRGKIFTASVIKRSNGERREMNCRLGVSKYVTGEGLKFDPAKKNLITVYDMQKNGYRMLNIDGLEELRIEGEEYTIENNT